MAFTADGQFAPPECMNAITSHLAVLALCAGVHGCVAAQPSCMPIPIATPAAVYSAALRQAEISGTVFFQFRVLPDGTVTDIQALEDSRTELVPAALLAVKQWRFAAHTCGDGSGVTIRSYMKFVPE